MSLGPFVQPSPANRLGFFEDAELSIELAHFARPIPTDAGLREQWEVRNTRKLATIPSMIARRCEGGQLWGAKTHSLAYCLPRIRESCGMPVKIIRTSRAVERSQRSADKSIGRHYDCAAISKQVDLALSNQPHLRIDYDDLLSDPSRAVGQIADHIGVAAMREAVEVIDAKERTVWQ